MIGYLINMIKKISLKELNIQDKPIQIQNAKKLFL